MLTPPPARSGETLLFVMGKALVREKKVDVEGHVTKRGGRKRKSMLLPAFMVTCRVKGFLTYYWLLGGFRGLGLK